MYTARYTLEQTARMVRVKPATVQYWHRVFSDFIGDICIVRGTMVYTDNQVALFRRIRDNILENGYSVAYVRQQLATKEDDHGTYTHLAHQVSKLRSEVAFLAEESKEHQRMLAELVKALLVQDDTAKTKRVLAEAARALHESTAESTTVEWREHVTVHEHYEAPLPVWNADDFPGKGDFQK